jgi:hypothetical protein
MLRRLESRTLVAAAQLRQTLRRCTAAGGDVKSSTQRIAVVRPTSGAATGAVGHNMRQVHDQKH